MAETEMETTVNEVNTEKDKISEEYAYLDRGGFSSEKFKIEVRGLPKFYGIAELKKLMNLKLGLNTSKIKRPRNGSHWLYACFQNDEERTKAIAALNGYAWKGKTLIAEVAKPAPDPLVRKRRLEEENPTQEKKKKEEDKSQEERLMDATTPYWNIPYDEQLVLKEKEIKRVLMRFDNEVWKMNKEFRKRIEDNRKIHDGLSFQLKPIQKSPVTEGYRNKCEFTVAIDDESKLPTVGFRLGSYATGTVAVAPIQGLKHISEQAKKAVLLFQEYVRGSALAPFSPADYSGHWRYLTVRNSSATGDVMLIVSMHPQDLSAEELDKIKKELIEYFSSDDAVACGIKSLYFEVITKKRAGEAAAGERPQHLLGDTHIVDTILGKHFRISPEAFFQVNTAGAEILYQTAIDMSGVTQDSSVIDICCGTGTIGLCFAKHCKKVLGLELVPEAVKDAKANAELNNISNCELFTGRAEDILPGVLARVAGDAVAIVDPPRAGLHMRAVTALRNSGVRRLVYVSCSPASATKNLVDLARASSKTLRGAPFVPRAAAALDLFPHTRHVELVVLFDREETYTKNRNIQVAQNNESKKEGVQNQSLDKLDDSEDVQNQSSDKLDNSEDVQNESSDKLDNSENVQIDNPEVV